MATCMITGCGLQIYPEYQFWGDLWEEGDCWVFNACGSDEGLSSPLNHTAPILNVLCTSYFQRRNVFVISKDNSALNAAATKYLNKEA